MLRLRHEQIAAWGSESIERFIDRACQRVSSWSPAPFGGEPNLRKTVAAEVARAREYGLCSPRAVMRFLALGAAYGAGFEHSPEHAWMREQLLDGRIRAPDDRMATLVDECIRRERLRESNARARERFAQARAACSDRRVSARDDDEPSPFALLTEEPSA